MNRKALKCKAKTNFKRHYWIFIIVCIFSSMMEIGYGVSTVSQEMQAEVGTTQSVSMVENIRDVIIDIAMDGEKKARKRVGEQRRNIKLNDTNEYLGRSKGVLSKVLNSFSSGGIVLSVVDGLHPIFESEKVVLVVLIFLSLTIYLFVWFFIRETYQIILARFFLEGRVYEKVPIDRFLYPVQTKMWPRMAWNMFVKSVYSVLWGATIIGGVIKHYSYYLVPYILAENPKMTARESITLSRRMMKGHKWECFVAELSFIGWDILEYCTFGLTAAVFSNPYKRAFFSEYYVELRELAKRENIPGAELLCDEYLYRTPDKSELDNVYESRRLNEYKPNEKVEELHGVAGFLSNWFGILLTSSEAARQHEKLEELADINVKEQSILGGREYPGLLSPAPMNFKLNITMNLMASRSYSVLNLVIMFFAFAFIGWAWEVIFHLITSGVFVNRGMLHGPWLPIYGFGGIMILVFLKKARFNPLLQFISAMVLCGSVEYFTGWLLEYVYDGRKWWNYSGYFLNIHGRICAEGVFVFGVGGLAIVYLIAPLLDNQLRKLNRRILIIISAVLILSYAADQMYSFYKPNTGKGITSAKVMNNKK